MAHAAADRTFETLAFDNQCLRQLPLDDPAGERHLHQRPVRGAHFSRVRPTPVEAPTLVCASAPALRLLGLSADQAARPDAAALLSGCAPIPGAEPAAHCYCGHQFGYFSGQLGDGATMYLGEVVNPGGERWELQLKGAGRTPYSRTADGRKARAPARGAAGPARGRGPRPPRRRGGLGCCRCCAPPSASSWPPRRWPRWACPPRGPAAWSPPTRGWSATRTTTATRAWSAARW